jgi:hypothetical protein
MTTRSRRVPAAALVLTLLLALDTLAWRVATNRLRNATQAWQTALGPKGWQLTSAAPVATGWPIAAELRLDRMSLREAASSGFAWTAARVTFGVSLLHPNRLTVRSEGAQTLAAPGLAPIRFHAEHLQAVLPLATPIQSAQASATQLTIATPDGDALIAATTLEASWQPAAAHLRLAAGPASLPAGHRWGLGQTVGALTLELIAHGAWPAGSATQAASRWRDSGGTLDVTTVALRWGALDATGTGQARLDGALQPAATLNLKVANPEAALSTLADAGAITRNVATAATAVLTLLELPARLTGRPGVLDLPLSLDDGTVALGQIPIARVPKLVWQGR